MAEDKTFRYGLIVLGLFLVMIGMFIMSVEKPQIYISFCTLGILMIAVGIVWSMCQCYPKIRVVSVDAETERFIIKKPIASLLENETPEKDSSQTPYTSQKEAEVYERSLPSYEQTQMKAEGSGECLKILSVPNPPPGSEGGTQPVVQAKADVHRDSESDGGMYNAPTCQREATGTNSQTERFCKDAPLASFQDDGDTSSVESASNSHLLQRWKDASQPVSATESQLGFKLPSYEDFALIDSLMTEGQAWSNEKTLAQNGSHHTVPVAAGDATLATGRPKLSEQRAVQNVEDDEMYYGIKEGLGDNLKSMDTSFETKK